MRDSQKSRDIHQEAVVNFGRVQNALYNERRQCLEDRRFYSIAGAQWEGSLSEQFENKPKFEMNKIHLSVMKIINEYRNNRITVDFISKDGSQNNGMADICDGLFRADERDSGAEEAYDNGFEEAVGGGFGAIRVTTQYEDEEDDENEKQRIRIEPIYDADSSVFFDLDAKRQDKADAKYCYVIYSMTPEEYTEEFGEELDSSIWKEIDFEEYDWYSPDLIYVAEYYRVEEKKETIRIFENNVGDEERYSDEDFEENEGLEEELRAIGSREVRTKKVRKKRVHKYIISGGKILEDCGYLAGKNIPIVPVYGKRWYVDSIERCMGHVRLSKDAQRLKNMLTSKLAEISSLSSVEKPIFVPEQVVQFEQMWAEDNIKNNPYLLTNPILDAAGNITPAGPIAYTKPPQIPPALAALMQIVDIDMKEMLGNAGQEEKMLSHVSGKAHEMIQKRIDGQAYIYMSNFSKAVQRIGEIWLDMAKDVYVEKGRKMKTIDNMGQVGQAELLKPSMDSEKLEYDNDLTKATFDVAVDVGPSSASQREATVQTIMGMMQMTQDPEDMKVLQSMAMMNMEGDGISDVNEYYRKKLVQMGVVKPTEEEAAQMAEAAKNAEPDPNEQALKAMATEALANAKNKEAEVFETLANTEKVKAQTLDILDQIDLKRLQDSRDYIEQVEKIQQQKQQMALQQQQVAIQASQNQQ